MSQYQQPDARGHFGPYGGIFVSETLMHALEELAREYDHYRQDPAFIAEFESELKHYVGRPSPVYHAKRLSDMLGGWGGLGGLATASAAGLWLGLSGVGGLSAGVAGLPAAIAGGASLDVMPDTFTLLSQVSEN